MPFKYFLNHYQVYSPSQVKKISKALSPLLQPSPTFIKKGPKGSIKDCTVSVVSWGKTQSFLRPFVDRAWRTNEEIFGVHIYPLREDYRFFHNVYKPGQQYSFHVDDSASPPTSCKLTCLLNLSTQPYSGGEFMLQPGGETLVIKEFNTPGTMVVFPSYILHKISPVIKGTRVSLAALLEGPKWV
jgi:hypothetical protein